MILSNEPPSRSGSQENNLSAALEQARVRFDHPALVVGQVEEVVDGLVYVGFEVVDVRGLYRFAVCFEPGYCWVSVHTECFQVFLNHVLFFRCDTEHLVHYVIDSFF